MEILRKGTVAAEFRVIRPKLYGTCAFQQNFHNRKLGEITAFNAVRRKIPVKSNVCFQQNSLSRLELYACVSRTHVFNLNNLLIS